MYRHSLDGSNTVMASTQTEQGDNCIQNLHLGRYIVGYTVGNHVLRLHLRVAVKLDFRPYKQRYTSPNENFRYGYPHSNALPQSRLKLERCKPHKSAQTVIKANVIQQNVTLLMTSNYFRQF